MIACNNSMAHGGVHQGPSGTAPSTHVATTRLLVLCIIPHPHHHGLTPPRQDALSPGTLRHYVTKPNTNWTCSRLERREQKKEESRILPAPESCLTSGNLVCDHVQCRAAALL
jgi:hypothetical protein